MKSKAIFSLVVSLVLLVANAGGMFVRAEGRAAAPVAPASQPLADAKTREAMGAQPSLRVVESSERGVVLELLTPGFALQPLTEAGCRRLTVEGYGATDTSGWPELPLRGAMVGIPPQAQVSLHVLDVESVIRRVGSDLCPVARPVVEYDAEGRLQYLGEERVRDASAYARRSAFFSAPAELVETANIRSQRVAQIRFQPFRYDQVSGEMRHDRRILVRVDFFPGEDVPASLGSWIDEGSFEPILQNALLNYEQACHWRARPEPTRAAQAVWPPHEGPWYKASVDEDGIYQMDYAYLQAAGVPVDELDPRTFRLYNMGQEVAIEVAGEGDGSFDSGDAIVFYGEKTRTRYTDVNVYWLTWGGDLGLRIASQDGTAGGNTPSPDHFSTVQRVEKNLTYLSRWPAPDGDRWYWQGILAVAPTSRVYTTEIPYLATGPLSATIGGIFWGLQGQVDHHTRVYLNGHLIEDAVWPRNSMHIFEESIPHSYLVAGTNVISVQLPFDMGGTYQYVYVNRFDIAYSRPYTVENDRLFFDQTAPGTWAYRLHGFSTAAVEVLRVTDPSRPVRFQNARAEAQGGTFSVTFEDVVDQEERYLAQAVSRRRAPLSIELFQSADLASSSNGADYLLITHADFYTSVLPLASYRAGQGLRVVVVDVADVYDQFGYGVFDPQAIHDFLAYAYANWAPPAPLYVLLVGDGNYDFKNYEGKGEPNYIPPYLDDVDLWLIETASDNRYVTVYGNDTLPDMYLGRLPAKTAAEASAMVGKILSYEQSPPSGDWRQRILFVADNADSAGDFAQISDSLINDMLPAPYTPQRVYLGVTHPYQNPSVVARQAILDAINEGRLLVNYIGHAGFLQWAIERLFKTEDVPLLTNSQRLPFMAPMTCYDGYFIVPSASGDMDWSSVGEAVVRAANGGAIGSFSPSGLGVATGHDYLNRGLFEAFFYDGIVQLGPATVAAKLYLYNNAGTYLDLLDTYMLFGDPALALNVLETDVEIDMAVQPQTPLYPGEPIPYTNSGPATAFHVVISNALPEPLLDPLVTSSGATITLRPSSRLTWDVADLPAGAGGLITITATVSPDFVGVLTSTAAIASTAVETDTTNNASAVLVTQVIAPDLAIDKEGPATALPGETISYVLTYANHGSAPAARVVIEDLLPAQVVSATFVASGAAVTPLEGTRFVWDAGDLLPGEGGVITITAELDPSFSGPLTNTASIASSTVEPRQADNAAVHVTWVPYRVYLPLALKRAAAATDLLPLSAFSDHALSNENRLRVP